MAVPRNNASRLPGVYVHIPFCRRKCRYCDFYSVAQPDMHPGDIAAFLAALDRESALVAVSSAPADTLYLGGGTPSLLNPGQLETLILRIRQDFCLTLSAEITVEVNPGTVSLDKLRAYAGLGCNRLNIGIQSFDDTRLAFLGRIHDARQALQTFHDARAAGFANIGIDLIYGLPGQTAAMWRKDLQTALDLQPEHISCYMLSYEPGTPLHAELQAGGITVLSEGRCADLFRLAHHTLVQSGFEHYEISNFAANPLRRSRHNQKYWNHVLYTGLGPSAHSFDLHRRSWNHADLRLYLALLGQDRRPQRDEEILTPDQQVLEAVFLGLRQADGIDPLVFQRRFNLDIAARCGAVLERWETSDWMHADGGRYRPTVDGMLFADRMAGELIEVLS